jgi:hypothetical protein
MKKLPLSMKQHFWDVDFERLDKNQNSFFITKRLLDHGNLDDIKWITSEYGPEEIKKVLTSSRDLSRKTANFWTQILGINFKQVPCLQKPYSRIHFGQSS